MLASASRLSRSAISAAIVSLGAATIEIGCAPADLQFFAPSVTGRPLPSFAPVVQGVMPTVVNVSAVQRATRHTRRKKLQIRRRTADLDGRDAERDDCGRYR